MNLRKLVFVLSVLYLSMTGFAAEADKADHSSAAAEIQKPGFFRRGSYYLWSEKYMAKAVVWTVNYVY